MVKRLNLNLPRLLIGIALIVACILAGRAYLKTRVINASNNFGFRLFRQVYSNKPSENTLLSPVGASTGLYMIYNGATGNTKKAMAATLGIDGLSPWMVNIGSSALLRSLKRPSLQFGGPHSFTRIWNSLLIIGRNPVSQHFVNLSKRCYRASVHVTKLGYGSDISRASRNAKDGNAKAANKANPLALCLMIDGMEYEGDWWMQFDKTLTRKADFHLANNTTKKVRVMQQTEGQWYLKANKFQALKLPFGDQRTSMYIFLPDPNYGLAEFLKTVNSQNWHDWMDGFAQKSVNIGLPRFDVNFGRDVTDELESLVGVAFNREKAEFRNIGTEGNAYISQAIVDAKITVDETGSVWSMEKAGEDSVSEHSVDSGSAPSMIMDRPFFFAIRDEKSGAILLMGTVVDPKE